MPTAGYWEAAITSPTVIQKVLSGYSIPSMVLFIGGKESAKHEIEKYEKIKKLHSLKIINGISRWWNKLYLKLIK